MHPSILFLIPCGRFALSGVFRVMDYIPLLEKDGFHCRLISYSSPLLYKWLYLDGGLNSFWNRKNYSIYIDRLYTLAKLLYLLAIAGRFEIIFIEKVTPPRWWVWILKLINRRIVYDIDDAVFLKSPKQTHYLIKNSLLVITGSHFILKYAQSINKETVLLPTPVPVHLYPPTRVKSKKDQSHVNIGWVGTTSGIKYLTLLEEPLARLSRKFPNTLRLTIIGHIKQCGDLKTKFPSLDLELIPFVDPQHISGYISKFDIGVMPLFNGDWEKGKCASKALVYMAANVPVVCSRVGENIHVIQDGVNGYLAADSEEWISKLSNLIEDPELREKVGLQGRKSVEEKYSTRECYEVLRKQVIEKVISQ